MHAVIKLGELGIQLSETEPEVGGWEVLTDGWFTPEVERRVRRLVKGDQRGAVDVFQQEAPDVQQRLALMGAVEEGSDVVSAALSAAVAVFERELQDSGHELDLVAEMEHNRWMGERLVCGWRPGPATT